MKAVRPQLIDRSMDKVEELPGQEHITADGKVRRRRVSCQEADRALRLLAVTGAALAPFHRAL